MLITSPNNIQFPSDLNIVFGQLNKRFKAKLLSLNFDKTCFIQFINESTCSSDIKLHMNTFEQLLKQNFWIWMQSKLYLIWTSFGLYEPSMIGSHQWSTPKFHIWCTFDVITLVVKFQIIILAIFVCKLQVMCLIVIYLIYFAYVHSILTYRIIFWGNSTHALKIFRMKKKNK
jgi:hypothetical protein